MIFTSMRKSPDLEVGYLYAYMHQAATPIINTSTKQMATMAPAPIPFFSSDPREPVMLIVLALHSLVNCKTISGYHNFLASNQKFYKEKNEMFPK